MSDEPIFYPLAKKYVWKIAQHPPQTPTDEEAQKLVEYLSSKARAIVREWTKEALDDLVSNFIVWIHLKEWKPGLTEDKIWMMISHPKFGLWPIYLCHHREHPESKGFLVCQMVEAGEGATAEDIIDPRSAVGDPLENSPRRRLSDLGRVSRQIKKD